MIELKHSKKLSKRLRIDPEFKKILQSKKRQLITLEKGISQIEDELDNESLFSNNRDFDSDDEFKALESLAIQNKAEHLLLKCRKKYNYQKQMVLKKKLEKIKQVGKKFWLTPIPIKREPNPIKSIRFFEYSFPLDSDFFDDMLPFVQKDYLYLIDVSDFKRVHTAYYDKEVKVFVTKLHEKTFNKDSNYSSNQQYKYYIDWLFSLNNSKAKYLADILDNVVQLKRQLHIKQLELDESLIKNLDAKIIVNEINADLKKQILSLPYLARISKQELIPSSEETGLIGEEYSQPFLRLLGFHEEKETDYILHRLLKFLAQKSIYTKKYFDSVISFLPRKNCKDIGLISTPTQQTYILVDKDGKDIGEFYLNQFEEKWYEKGIMYKKTYTIFENVETSYNLVG